MFLHSLKTSLPLLKASGSARGVLLSPLPRYWVSSCCEDIEHNTNRPEEDFEDYVFSGVDNLRRQCKDFLFKNKLAHLRVLNTAQLICGSEGGPTTSIQISGELAATWGTDPMHPAAVLTRHLAINLITTSTGAEASSGEPSCSTSTAPHLQPAKRPRWLAEQTVEEVRPMVYNATRGRGRGRGRGGYTS